MEHGHMETMTCKCCGREVPLSSFTRTKLGLRYTCNECMKRKVAAGREERKKCESTNELERFTPRQLMEELVRRGYVGKLRYVETHIIDLENF